MFLPTTEAKYFCKEGWTPLSTSRPSGKSQHGSESKSARIPDAARLAHHAETGEAYGYEL
jgi:hypothetical protein